MKTEYLEITAAAGGRKPSVKGVAYSGGKMRLFGWSRPVVVDMAGMSVPETARSYQRLVLMLFHMRE